MRRGQTGLRLILLVAVPLVAVAGGVFWWLSGGRYVSTDNAYVKRTSCRSRRKSQGRCAACWCATIRRSAPASR